MVQALPPTGFDHGAVEALQRQFTLAADLLDRQAGDRARLAGGPRAVWVGQTADDFDERVRLTVEDAGEFADAFRRAVTSLGELADAACREDDRRARARQWEASQDRGFWGNVGDNIHDFAFGDDDLPPPPPPEPEIRHDVLTSACGTR